MGKNAKWMGLLFAATVVVVVVILVASEKMAGGLQYKPKMFEAGVAVASALFIVTLFIERGVAVVYALLYGDKLQQAELGLKKAAAGKLDEDAALQALADELNFKERLRILLTFVAGLWVSLAGVRTLEGLLIAHVVPIDPGKMPVLLTGISPWFTRVDIVLTAALIAGGSNALAAIIDIIKKKMTEDDSKYSELRARLTTTS